MALIPIDISQRADVAAAFIEHSLAGDHPAVTALMSRIEPGAERMEFLFDAYLKLYDAVSPEATLQCVVNACALAQDLDLMKGVADRIYHTHNQILANNIYIHYINSGGREAFPFQACIIQSFNHAKHDFVVDLYERLRQVTGVDTAEPVIIRMAAQSYLRLGKLDSAWQATCLLRRVAPDFPDLKPLVQTLAYGHSVPGAVLLQKQINQGLASQLPAIPARSGAAEWILDASVASLAELVEAVNAHGVCLVRNGCLLPDMAEIMDRIGECTRFPENLAEFPMIDPSTMFRFDAPALVSTLLGKPASQDMQFSVVRKVAPGETGDHLPYHQDVTAFATLLVNIWAPFTPVGGEYPSIEFVRERITIAEQTELNDGEYNQIEINEAYVRNKYGDRLWVVEDARPGDCVVFLGTTIHRSFSFSSARSPRYSAEIRWR